MHDTPPKHPSRTDFRKNELIPGDCGSYFAQRRPNEGPLPIAPVV